MAVTVLVRGPEWFFGLDSLFEGFAGLVLLLVSLTSWKAYSFTGEKRYRSFALAFGLMTLGFVTRALTDLGLHFNLFKAPQALFFGGYVAFIFLTLASLVLLFALTLKARERAPFVALLLVSLVLVLLSSSYFLSYHAISVILFGFVSWHFVRNYFEKKSFPAACVAGAFVLMTLAQVQFIVDVLWKKWYILGNLSFILGIFLLFAALVRVLRTPLKLKKRK